MDRNTVESKTTTTSSTPLKINATPSSKKKDKRDKSKKSKKKRLPKESSSKRREKEIKEKNDKITEEAAAAAASEIGSNNDSSSQKKPKSSLKRNPTVNNEDNEGESEEKEEIVKENAKEVMKEKETIEGTNNNEIKQETREETENNEYKYSKVLETFYRNNAKNENYLTLPKCNAPTTPEYKKTEDFMKQAITDATRNNTTSTSPVYASILQSLQKHTEDYVNDGDIHPKDIHMLYKLLHSLRKSVSTMATAIDYNGKHMHRPILHLIFSLSTTYITPNNLMTPIDIRKELNAYEQSVRSQVSKSVVRHRLALLRETRLEELKQKEIDREEVFDMYYDNKNNDNDHKLLLVHLQFIIELVSCNDIFFSPALSFLFRMFWNMEEYNYKDDLNIHSRIHFVHCCIRTLLIKTPIMNTKEVIPVIKGIYPVHNMKFVHDKIVYFTLNCLIASLYMPSYLQGDLLKIVYGRCLQFDIELRVAKTKMIKDGNDGNTDMIALSKKLDVLMQLVLEYHKIQSSYTNCNDMYNTYKKYILPMFQSSIINTNDCKYMPFILFITCGNFYSIRKKEIASLEEQEKNNNGEYIIGSNSSNKNIDTKALSEHEPDALYRDFCSTFLKAVLENKRSKNERQLYMQYLASFISRAKYVDEQTICETLNRLLKWILEVYKYNGNNTQGRGENHPIRVHSLFYTISQCTFFILCSRWEEVLHYFNAAVMHHNKEEEHDSNEVKYYPPISDIDIQPKSWEKVCKHPLKPLKYCSSDSIRNNFIQLAKNLDLVPEDVLKNIEDSIASIGKKRKRLSCAGTPMKNKKRRKSSIGNSIITPATMQLTQKQQETSFSTLNISSASSKYAQGITNRGANITKSYHPTSQLHFPFDDPFLLKQCYSLHVEQYFCHWKDIKDVEIEEES